MTPRRAGGLAALAGTIVLVAAFAAGDGVGFTEVVLTLVGAMSLLFGVATMARPDGPFAVPAAAVVTPLGAVADIVILIRLLDLGDGDNRTWVWIALAGCLGITAAGIYGMKEEPVPSGSSG